MTSSLLLLGSVFPHYFPQPLHVAQRRHAEHALILPIGLGPYSPLGRGYLTGKIDESATFASSDIRTHNPRFTPEAIRDNRVVIDLLDRIGRERGATPAQVALAWLLAQKPWIVPIPGSRKLDRLEENIGAVNVELTPEDLREIDDAMAKIALVGGPILSCRAGSVTASAGF